MARRTGDTKTSLNAPPNPNGLPLNTDIALSLGTARLLASPENPRQITLSLDGTHSSFIDLDDPEFLLFEYMQYMACVIQVAERESWRALHIGAAGCSMARWVHATHPGSHQLGLELDAKLADYVRQWFDLPRAPALRLRSIDGLEYLNSAPPQRWDLIIRDVFQRARIPGHLASEAYVGQMLRVLDAEGVYLANGIGHGNLAQIRQELATFTAHGVTAQQLAVIAEPAVLRGRRYGNVVIGYCARGAQLWQSAALGRALRSTTVPAHVVTDSDLLALLTPVG